MYTQENKHGETTCQNRFETPRNLKELSQLLKCALLPYPNAALSAFALDSPPFFIIVLPTQQNRNEKTFNMTVLYIRIALRFGLKVHQSIHSFC